MFKDLKAGNKIYILSDTDDCVKVIEANVTNVSQPHLDMFSGKPNQMVIDLSIEEDGVPKTYSIPDNLSVTYTKDKVLVCDTSELVKEAEQIRLRLSEEIDGKIIEQKRTKLKQANNILSKYSPFFREKADTESRISNIEKGLENIKTMLNTLINK